MGKLLRSTTLSESKSPTPRILIVDDVPENLRVLSQTLSSSGYQVRSAINGKLAMMSIAADPPDLILLDIMMPEMDGFEVCHKLRSDPLSTDIPIIFISALGEAHSKVQAFEIGGTDYVCKPFHLAEVLARVEHQLELRRLQRKLCRQNDILRDTLRKKEQAELEIRMMNRDLEKKVQERTLELKVANESLLDQIRERHQAQAQLLHRAQYDPLTGCASRTFLLKNIEEALALNSTDSTPDGGLLLLDCNRFTSINDTLGHLMGDQLLVEIANRLFSLIPSGSLVSRLRGDEFAILFRLNHLDISEFVVNVQHILEQPMTLGNCEVSIYASIGIVLADETYQKAEHLLRDAYQAKERAKHQLSKSWQIFKPEMHRQALHNLSLEGRLRRAIELQKLEVHYQPIVDLKSFPEPLPIRGFEALVRWPSESGFIPPADFISLAEETGLIEPLGAWVLQTAAQQISHWNHQNAPEENLFVSINFSVLQLHRPGMADFILEALSRVKCEPHWIKVEITESVLMDTSAEVIHTLTYLREKGIKICIDDFGTGYSSLNYLSNLPVDVIKIDRSFVRKIESEHSSDLPVLSTIFNLAKILGLEIIVEGIENQYQAQKMSAMNCCFGQGYLFGRPMNSNDVRLQLIQN